MNFEHLFAAIKDQLRTIIREGRRPQAIYLGSKEMLVFMATKDNFFWLLHESGQSDAAPTITGIPVYEVFTESHLFVASSL